MSAPAIERRIFIVGAPRSGTTLLQSLLAAHSQLTSFTESHFWSRHFRRVPGLGTVVLRRDPVPRARQFIAENDAEPRLLSGLTAGSAPPRALATRAASRELVALLDRVAHERGASGWIEKTPRHLLFVPFLDRQLEDAPGTHFVHIVRDGLETVASLYAASRSWERAYDLPTCVRRWNDDVKRSLARLHSARDHFVFYERLTDEPEPCLRSLLAALGLGWEPSMLDDYGKVAARLVRGDEPWKSEVGRALAPSKTSEQVLSAEQRASVSAALRCDLYRRLRQGVAERDAARSPR